MLVVEVGYHVVELMVITLHGESVDLLLRVFERPWPDQTTASFLSFLDGLLDGAGLGS